MVAALSAAPALAQPPQPGPPVVLDGPSGALGSPSGLGMSIARDGTGGLVYLKAVSGTSRVFVSRLAGGAFQTPVEVDSQLSGPSSQPVIAALNGGVLLIAFINAGQLEVVQTNAAGQFSSPSELAGGAINPDISATNFGKAYIAFAEADGSGHDVRTAYYYNGSWALEPQPLNAIPADDAGSTTATRPAVAAAGDGIAIVVWGEQGHIYSRRVWGTQPSVVGEQADATAPSGCTQQSVDSPVVGAGGDSSYATVAYHAVLFCGSQRDQRVLLNRLQGSAYDGVTEADGLGPTATDGADDPQIAMAEYGDGWVTAAGTASDDVLGATLGANGAFSGVVSQVNGLSATEAPDPIPAIAGIHSSLIAWQQVSGFSPGGEIRLRFAPGTNPLGPEIVLSSPSQGPIDSPGGLVAAGDISGDAAVAWLQGSPSAPELVVGQLYQPPGGFSPAHSFLYTTRPQPVLAWSRPAGWGPLSYSVTLDGAPLSPTYATSVQVPVPLIDGPHSWRVTASNPAGQQSAAAPATVFVDTVAPTAALKMRGRASVGSTLHVVVRYVDRPPVGEPGAQASGVAKVVVRWGDGSGAHLSIGTHSISHLYKRVGRYEVTVTVTDRAGNVTKIVKFVKVVRPSHRHRSSKKAHR